MATLYVRPREDSTAVTEVSEASSDASYISTMPARDGGYEAKIEDLILLTSEQTMISMGLETLEDLVTKLNEEIRMRGLSSNEKFDADIHETKYEEFQRRYRIR